MTCNNYNIIYQWRNYGGDYRDYRDYRDRSPEIFSIAKYIFLILN